MERLFFHQRTQRHWVGGWEGRKWGWFFCKNGSHHITSRLRRRFVVVFVFVSNAGAFFVGIGFRFFYYPPPPLPLSGPLGRFLCARFHSPMLGLVVDAFSRLVSSSDRSLVVAVLKRTSAGGVEGCQVTDGGVQRMTESFLTSSSFARGTPERNRNGKEMVDVCEATNLSPR